MISVVIPTLQEENYIEDTVRQFTRLSIPHEVIVSDGGSADRTVEIARAAGAQIVLSAERKTPSHQRNAGAKQAKGEVLLFIDSSVVLPDTESFLTAALKHFEDPAVLGYAVPQWIDPKKATFSDRVVCTIVNWTLALSKGGSGKFVMVRRSAFEALMGFREDLVTREDGDFYIRLNRMGEVVFDKSQFIYYSGRREHAYGWPKLLSIWMINVIWVTLFNKALTKEWTPVR